MALALAPRAAWGVNVPGCSAAPDVALKSQLMRDDVLPGIAPLWTRWVQGERVFMHPYLILIRTARRHCLAKVLAPRRAAAWGGRTGETTMAKVVDDVARVDEPARLALSPSVRPCPLALADRDRRAELEPRDLTAWFFGDPLPGMSALDRRNRTERTH